MAAEFLLTFVMEESLKKLSSLGVGWISGACGLKRELKKLGATTRMIQEVLQDAEEKQARDVRVKAWLQKLQDVVYSAGDVLDEFSYETLRRKVEIQSLKLKAREFISHNNPILFRIIMANKVKKINESLTDIEREASLKLTLQKIVRADGVVAVESQLMDRKTDSLLDRSETPIGRTRDVEAIINMMQVGSSTPPLLTVISIVGIGGLGKTTLAKLVVKEVKEKKLFDKVMWVCVSEPLDYRRILLEMLQNLDKNTGALTNDNAILEQLQHQLTNKRFLLVLDDVWNENPTIWNSLKNRLDKICPRGGNFIIVTTRSLRVAEVMDTTTQHLVKLQQLPHETCLSIIKNKWLEKWVEPMPEELETPCVEIAKRCGGVPLAAQVLGGTLCCSKEKEFWLSIQHSNMWEAIGEDNGILPILKLSFDHLPPPLKQCFAYCSLFPKDFVFRKEVLIQLWMAQEFLNATSTNRGASSRLMEDVGEEYLNSLIANSFFQDVRVNVVGKIYEFKMHDLLHDLAMSVSNTQILPSGTDCIFKTSHGRRLDFDNDQVLIEDDTRNLRFLFSKVDVSRMLPNCKSLRSLDISDAKLKEIPHVIGKLKHLRYLDISRNKDILEVPDSITKLYNLQTLRLLECESLRKLPSGIGNLVSLRHIHFDNNRLMPSKVGCLTNLQTLPFFVVGVQKGQTINELEGLNELRGKLVVCDLENVRDKREAERAKMKEKKLSKLVLQWLELEENEVENFSSSREDNHEEVMEGLEAPTSIESLRIELYMGKQFSQWMSELTKLVHLTLKNCRRCVTMPTLGHLPNLKVLKVERMDSMKSIGSEFYGESNNVDTLFPLLEEFSIRKMKSLVEWVSPKGTKIFPKLREVSIEDCPDLTSFPLSQLTSSATYMRLQGSEAGEATVYIKFFLDFKSLEYVGIWDCPKLTFLHIGLTSPLVVNLSSRIPFLLVKNLSLFSDELGESWKNGIIDGAVEIIREFPKSLEALQIDSFDNKLSVEAFHDLSCLKHLEITSCDGLESIPTLSSLTSLEHLEITSCDGLESIPTLSSLTSLKHLEITYCDRLESIPTLSSLTSLKHLEITDCDRLESIPTLSSLTSLKHLEITDCDRLESIPTLSSLTSLKHLEITDCDRLESIPTLSSLTSLKHLEITYCDRLESIPTLSSLTSLKHLEITDCDRLESIPTLSSLTSLKHLEITDCDRLESIPTLSSLTSLKHLEITDCDRLESIPTLSSLTSLKHLEITDCDRLESIPTLSSLTSLKHLEITYCDRLESIPTLSSLTSLKHLEITDCDRLESIPTLSSLTSLKHLEISSCSRLESIPTISSLTSLKHLEIVGCSRLGSIPTLSSLTYLKHLEIRVCPLLESIPTLSSLTSLKHLEIRHCDRLESIPAGLKLCTSLKELHWAFCREMVSTDDDIIGSLTQLKELHWGGFSEELDKVPGLNSIYLLTSLEKVKIYGWKRLTSLPHQLQHLTSITELGIYHFDGVETLPDWLCNLSSLQTLVIYFCKNLKNLPMAMQRLFKLTRLEIRCCPLLEERCAKDIGPEWSNISHIPHIEIQLQVIQDLRSGTNAEISI